MRHRKRFLRSFYRNKKQVDCTIHLRMSNKRPVTLLLCFPSVQNRSRLYCKFSCGNESSLPDSACAVALLLIVYVESVSRVSSWDVRSQQAEDEWTCSVLDLKLNYFRHCRSEVNQGCCWGSGGGNCNDYTSCKSVEWMKKETKERRKQSTEYKEIF